MPRRQIPRQLHTLDRQMTGAKWYFFLHCEENSRVRHHRGQSMYEKFNEKKPEEKLLPIEYFYAGEVKADVPDIR